MPWAYRTVWKTRPNGNPYQSQERYWVASSTALRKPVVTKVSDPKVEANTALAERRAILAKTAKPKTPAVVVTGAQRAAAKAAADRAAADAKKKATEQLWRGLTAAAAAARHGVAGPGGPAAPKPRGAPGPGFGPVKTPTVKTSPTLDDLDPRDEQTLARKIKGQERAAALKSAADIAAIAKKRNDKFLKATSKEHKWDPKSGQALEGLITDARTRQVNSKGMDMDPAWLDKLVTAYMAYTKHVSDAITHRNDHLKQFSHKVKGKLVYKSLADMNAAEAYMKSSGYDKWITEAKRLWGKDLKNNTGTYTAAWKDYGAVGDTQRYYLRDAAKAAFLKQGGPQDRAKNAFAWESGEKWKYIASLDDIKAIDTGYDYTYDPKSGGLVQGHKRTVEEEFNYRSAQFEAEEKRRFDNAYRQMALTQVGMRNEAKLMKDEKYAAGPAREASKYIANSISVLGLTDDAQRVGQDPRMREKVVDDSLATWESNHIRFYQHQVKTDSGRMEMRFKSVKDQLAYDKEKEAFRTRLYLGMSADAPSFIGDTLGLVPGLMPLGKVLGAVGSLPEVGFRLAAAWHPFTDGGPGGSRYEFAPQWNDLPDEVQKAALADPYLRDHPSKRQDYVEKWLKTPAGKSWYADRQNQYAHETADQNARFIRDFYGDGDIWQKLDALAEFGANPTTDPILNMIAQFAFDPTVKLPFNLLTWGARYAHAMEVTSGLNKFKRIPKALVAFQNVEEPLLRAKALKKVYQPLVEAGEAPSKIVETILADLVKIGDEEGADAMRERLQRLGLEKRHISGELVLSQVSQDLREVWSSMGIDYEDMLTKAKSELAAKERAIALKKAREAKSPHVAADAARTEAKTAEAAAEGEAIRARAATRREKLVEYLTRRTESPAPSRGFTPRAAATVETAAEDVLRREAGAPLEDVVHAGPPSEGWVREDAMPPPPPRSRGGMAGETHESLMAAENARSDFLNNFASGGLMEQARAAAFKTRGDAKFGTRAEVNIVDTTSGGFMAIADRAGRPGATASGATPDEALRNLTAHLLADGTGPYKGPTIPPHVLTDPRDIAWERAAASRHLETEVDSVISREVAAAGSVHADPEGTMAAVGGYRPEVVVHDAKYSPGPYFDALRETPAYKEAVAAMDEPILIRGSREDNTFARRRADQIKRKTEAQKYLFEHGRQSWAKTAREEGRLVPGGGGLRDGVVPWRRTIEGEAYTVEGGLPSHQQPIANAPMMEVLGGAHNAGEGGEIVTLRVAENKLRLRALKLRARLGLVDAKGNPAKGSLTFEEYIAELHELSLWGVVRREKNLTIDMKATEGSLVQLSEMDYLRATGAESRNEFIPVGEAIAEEFWDNDALGHYYESFSVLPGMNRGPGYETALMDKILNNPAWRRALGRRQFAAMFRRSRWRFTAYGPREFREKGAHLNALFQHILLDDYEAFQHVRDGLDDLATGKITQDQYKVILEEGYAMSNGGMQQLHDLGQTVRVLMTDDDENPLLRMWIVLETRAGVHWASSFMDAESGFLGALVRVEGNRLIPNMALSMIPFSPLSRGLPVTHGFTGRLRSLAATKSPLFRPSLAGWTDEVVLANLQMMYHQRAGATAAVTQATQVIHYLMSRYGDTITRKHITDARTDLSIMRSHVGRDATPAGKRGWANFRTAYIESREAAHLFANKVPATADDSAGFGKDFDDIFSAGKPFEKALRQEFTPDVREIYDRLYWSGRITHDSAGLHTIAFLERMGNPKYQRGDDYLNYVESYYKHMARAGSEEDAHQILEVVLEAQIGATSGDAFEVLTHMGETSGPVQGFKYGRLRRFLLDKGFLKPMEDFIAAGKQREHRSNSLGETEVERLRESGELLLDDQDAVVGRSEGRRMFDGATAENIVDRVRAIASRLSATLLEGQALAEGEKGVDIALREFAEAQEAVRSARAAHLEWMAGLSVEARRSANRYPDNIKELEKALEESLDRARVMVVAAKEAQSVDDELAQAMVDYNNLRQGNAPKPQIRAHVKYVKELREYRKTLGVEYKSALEVVTRTIPRPDKADLDVHMEAIRNIGKREAPEGDSPLFGSEGVLKYLASLPDGERQWAILRYREDFLKSQLNSAMNAFNYRLKDMESMPPHMEDQLGEIVDMMRAVPGGVEMLNKWALSHGVEIEHSLMRQYTKHLEMFGYTEEAEAVARRVGRSGSSDFLTEGRVIEGDAYPEGYFEIRHVSGVLHSELALLDATIERGWETTRTAAGGEVKVPHTPSYAKELAARRERLAREVAEVDASLANAPVVDERELDILRKLYPQMPDAERVAMATRSEHQFSSYPEAIASVERSLATIERGLSGNQIKTPGFNFPRWLSKEQKVAARKMRGILQTRLENLRSQYKMELESGRAKPGRGEMHNASASQAAETVARRVASEAPAAPVAKAPAAGGSIGERLKAALPGRRQPYFQKDLAKAREANKFIGAGSPGSSTAVYAEALGGSDTAFAATDTVFVSANGARAGRVPVVDEHGVLTAGFKPLDDAIEAGARIRTDVPASRVGYNLGEREVAEYLHEHGYAETTPGRWEKQALDPSPPVGVDPSSSSGRVVNLRDAPKGWENDPNYVYVGRAGKGFSGEWGNPFPLQRDASAAERAHVIADYREWILKQPDIEKRLESLKGKTLVCFCSPLACHGDVLAELANGLVEPALAEAHDLAVAAGNAAARTVPVEKVPIVRSVDELTELVANEPELFMRWTPDLRADMQPGAHSSALDPFQGIPNPEAGISSLAVPYARGTAAEAIISPVGAAKYDLGPAHGDFAYRRGGRAGTAGFKRRTAWMVRGKVVGYGIDGEPLLDPTSIVPVAAVSRKTVDDYVELHRAGKVGGKGTVKTGGVAPAVAGVTRRQQFQKAIDEVYRGADAVDPDTGHPVDARDRNAALADLHDRMNALGPAGDSKVVPRSTDFVPGVVGSFDGPFRHPDVHPGDHPWFAQMDYGPSYRGPMSKIHVAATALNGQEILRIVDAIARDMHVTYKWVKSIEQLIPPQTAFEKGKEFAKGGSQQGKFITAYPDPSIAAEFTRRLDEALQNAGIVGGDVAASERRYAPDSPITHRFVPDSGAGGERFAPDGDYATNPDYIGYRKGSPEDLKADPVAAAEAAGREAAAEMAGPAAHPPPPDIPDAPDPLVLNSEGRSVSARALEIISGMTEDEYLAHEMAKAWRMRRVAKTPAARKAASARVYELEKAMRVIRWAKGGKTGSLGRTTSRHTKSVRVAALVGKRAQSAFSPRAIGPLIFSPGGGEVEQGRSYYRLWKSAIFNPKIRSRIRRTGPVSPTYKAHGARVEAEMSKPIIEATLPRYGYRADQLSELTYTELVTGIDQFDKSLKDPAFSAWKDVFKADLTKRLRAITKDDTYTIDDWLSDRLQVRDVDHFDPKLFEEVEPEVARSINAERPGEFRTTKTDLKRAPGDIPPEVKTLAEIVENDVRAVVGRNRVLAARGIDPHAYAEAWKVLRKPLQSKRYSLDIFRLATEKASKALYAAGHGVDDADWDALFFAERNRQFIAIRQTVSDKEALKLLNKLTNAMVGATPRQIIEEFERRYLMDMEIKEFQPPEVTLFQQRTLEEAAKYHLQVTDLNDKDQMIVGLGAHGQKPPYTSREAMRKWLVDYGFWSPRTADAIDSGKASWSVQQEDEFFTLSWGHPPEWADVSRLQPGGDLREAVLFDEVLRAKLYREWGSFTRNMRARLETGDMSRGERARFLVEGSAELDVKPKRDLSMERQYVKERFRELAYDEKTDRLIAFPELMTPEELEDFIAERGLGNVPDRVFQTRGEFDVYRQVMHLHVRRYVAAHPFAGKTATWKDFFQYTSAIAHDVLKDPIWMARDRDQIGSLLKFQAAVRRALVFTQIGFVMLNVLDTGIKGPWAAWQLRSFATDVMSDVAANLTVKKMGWDPTGQILHELDEVGTKKIKGAFTRPRALYNVGGVVMEENNLDRAFQTALGVAVGISELPAQGSRWAENATKLRLAQKHYDGVLAMYIKMGEDPKVAHALTIAFLNHEIGRLWPTAGNGPIETLFNQISPFASYQFKNRLVYIGELASHPVLFNYFDHIGDIIETRNRENWEKGHPGEVLPDYLARLIELPWAPGTFIDLGQLSDVQRGFKTATDVIGGSATLESLAANFIRLAGPNDINFVEGWANALHWGTHQEWVETLDGNGEPTGQWHQVEALWQAPWGGDANWLNSFWPVELATQFKQAMEGHFSATEVTLLMYRAMFFGGLKSYDRGAGINDFYWAFKAKNPELADKWLDETPQGSDLKTWWVEKAPRSKTGYTHQDVLDILHPPKADSYKWLHSQSQEYQDHITGLLDTMNGLRTKWDNVIADLAPGSKEFSTALLSKQNERYGFIAQHPELYDYFVASMSPTEWAEQLDEWQVDDLTQTFYDFEKPERKAGESEAAFQKRMARYLQDKEDYLKLYPQVAQRINNARNVTEMVWKAVEDHWFTDILTDVGTTQIAIDAAKSAKNFSLSDQLYLMKELQSEGLNEETAVQYFNPVTDYKPLTNFDKERGRDPQLREGPFGQRLLPKAMVLPDMQTWLYNRANPAKQAAMRRDDRYAREISDVINKAKKSGNFPKTFVELIKGNPWLMAEYFRRNPGKREKWATNDVYIGYMGKWHSFIAKGDWAGADKYFNSLPVWAQDKYLNKHPKARANRANSVQNLKYLSLMKRWSDFYRHRDYAGGAAFFAKLPQWAKDRYYSKHPTGFGRSGGTGSSPYSRAMGKWVKLLQDNKDDEAKAYFNSLPQAYKDRYYSTHPEAKIRNDIKRVGQLSDYFSMDDANRIRYLEDNPEFSKWLKAQGNSEQTRRMLIMAAYQNIPNSEQWLRRVYREKYPEIFSKEAAGARAVTKVTATLAEHPEMTPAFQKWLELILSTYAEELKHAKAPPKPLTINHQRQHGMTGVERAHGGKSAAWVRLHSLS